MPEYEKFDPKEGIVLPEEVFKPGTVWASPDHEPIVFGRGK